MYDLGNNPSLPCVLIPCAVRRIECTERNSLFLKGVKEKAMPPHAVGYGLLYTSRPPLEAASWRIWRSERGSLQANRAQLNAVAQRKSQPHVAMLDAAVVGCVRGRVEIRRRRSETEGRITDAHLPPPVLVQVILLYDLYSPSGAEGNLVGYLRYEVVQSPDVFLHRARDSTSVETR